MRSELFAAKLVLSRPLLGGNVMIGAEYSHTERQDDYVNPEGYDADFNSGELERAEYQSVFRVLAAIPP
mgnify:CR=1 FL=1